MIVKAMQAAQRLHGGGRGFEIPDVATFKEAQALLDRGDELKHLGRGY
jgi:hypothetical protein